MRALVTGAAGFVGAHLASRLARDGWVVRGLDRPGGTRPEGFPAAMEWVEGDVTAPATLAAAVQGVDVAFHLAGVRRAPDRASFLSVNAGGTRNLCEALAAAGGRPRIVVASSIAAMGPSRDSPDEDAPLAPVEAYGESKAEAERIARSFEDRLEVVLARPARIVGPGDRENLAFFRLVKRGIALSLSGGPRPFSVIDIDDAVDALVRMGARHEAPGRAFFVARRETATIEEVQAQAAKILGVRPRQVTFPPAVFLALAAAADLASSVSGHHLPLNRKLARQLLAPGWTCSTRRAEELLGFVPRVSLAESIERAGRWYLEKGWV